MRDTPRVRLALLSLPLALLVGCVDTYPDPAVQGQRPPPYGQQPPPPVAALTPLSPEAAVEVLLGLPPPPPWRAHGSTNYERQRGGQGLGASLRYEGPTGHADLFVYDAGQLGLRSGVDDPRTRDALADTVREVLASKRPGGYDHVQVHGTGEVRIGGVPWLQATMTIVRQGVMLDSFTYLRAEHGYFVKFRVSVASPSTPAVRDDVLGLVAERQRHLAQRFSDRVGGLPGAI